MDFGGAPNTDAAASLPGSQQSRLRLLGRQIDDFLEAERAQLPLWAVVAFGAGIGAWFWLQRTEQWLAAKAIGGAIAASGFIERDRLGRALLWAGLLFAAGVAWIWLRSDQVASPRVARIVVETFEAEVENVEPLVAKERIRLTLAPQSEALPPRVRVSLRDAQWVDGIGAGATVRVRARLMPPPGPALPGGYDFSRKVWCAGIDGVGTVLGDIDLLEASLAEARPACTRVIGGIGHPSRTGPGRQERCGFGGGSPLGKSRFLRDMFRAMCVSSQEGELPWRNL